MPTSIKLSVNKKFAGLVLSERKRIEGFTLVELLVVISIIAILSVAGMVVYTNVQLKARDAKRKGDIDAIAKAMEVNYNRITPFQYSALCAISSTSNDCTKWFGGGNYPVDPKDGSTNGCAGNLCKYCDRTGSGFGLCVGASPRIDVGVPGGGASGFVVCANLEAGSFYCRSNQQ